MSALRRYTTAGRKAEPSAKNAKVQAAAGQRRRNSAIVDQSRKKTPRDRTKTSKAGRMHACDLSGRVHGVVQKAENKRLTCGRDFNCVPFGRKARRESYLAELSGAV